jgi:tRNA (guanine-N7-)-methyltransferase
MFANSRIVESTQHAPHPRLPEIVARHLHMPYRREPSAAGRAAFATVETRLREPFILDAGCGTGASTIALAQQFPDYVVLGVDKSVARLAVGRGLLDRSLPDRALLGSERMVANAILLHCELVDFWQLAAAAGLRCERQYLLYPNPWPKGEQLKRRWHAHPIFPAILALGEVIELRTNWRVYAEEFAQALEIAGACATSNSFLPDAALTPFERKYAASRHDLWRVTTANASPAGGRGRAASAGQGGA